MLDDVEKLTWKQVGFFMSKIDRFCQPKRSINNQNPTFPMLLPPIAQNLSPISADNMGDHF